MSDFAIGEERAVKVASQDINRGFFDRKDPVEGLGKLAEPFSFAQMIFVSDLEQEDKLNHIRNDLYTAIHERVATGVLKNVKIEIKEYKDIEVGKKESESPRRYLILEQETARNTLTTSLVRVIVYGNNLYIASDSYILGSTRWLAFFVQALIFLIIAGAFLGDQLPPSIKIILFPFAVTYLFRNWIEVVRALRQGANLSKAIRQRFYRFPKKSSFDQDDILMFLKGAVPLILEQIEKTFEKYGIEVSFDQTTQKINNIGTLNQISGNNTIGNIGSVANSTVQARSGGK